MAAPKPECKRIRPNETDPADVGIIGNECERAIGAVNKDKDDDESMEKEEEEDKSEEEEEEQTPFYKSEAQPAKKAPSPKAPTSA